MNSTPTTAAVFLSVPGGLALVAFISYLLVVIDVGVNKPLTPICDLTHLPGLSREVPEGGV
jgi:hypothetical protein